MTSSEIARWEAWAAETPDAGKPKDGEFWIVEVSASDRERLVAKFEWLHTEGQWWFPSDPEPYPQSLTWIFPIARVDLNPPKA